MGNPRSPRNHMITALLVTLIGLGLTACGGDGESETSTDPIRVVLGSAPTSMNPITTPRGLNQAVWATILDPLVATDENLEPAKTGLITDWERQSPTTWVFTVREGVLFSNGEKANADAVANTLTLTYKDDASLLKSFFGNVIASEATDSTHVTVTMRTPQYNLPTMLTTVYLVPPKYYKDTGGDGFASKPIGTGPYVLKESRAGRDILVVKNEDYWGEAPKNDAIRFTWSEEPSQRLALLRTEAADVALDLPFTQVKEAEEAAGLNVVTSESSLKAMALLQADKPPFDDPTVRKAAALAIDRNAIVEGIFQDQAVPDAGVLNVLPGTSPKESVEYDPQEAERLLGGRDITIPITYTPGRYAGYDDAVQAMGRQLEDVGFNVKYNTMDYGALVGMLLDRSITGLYVLVVSPVFALPEHYATGFMKSDSIAANCPSPEVDRLVQSALEATDAEAAEVVYDELNSLMVVDQNCYIPLYRQNYSYATLNNIEGFYHSPLDTFDFSKIVRK